MRKIRNPLIAAICSLLWIGWGQWYNGKTKDGILYIGAYMVSAVLATLLALPLFSVSFWAGAALVVLSTLVVIGILGHSIYNAYKTADKINKGEVGFTRKSRLFWVPASMYVFIIIMMAVIMITGPVSPAAGLTDGIPETPAPPVTASPAITTPQATGSAASDTPDWGMSSLLIQQEDLPADYAPPRYALMMDADMLPNMKKYGAQMGFAEYFSIDPNPQVGTLLLSQRVVMFPEGNATKMVDSDYVTYSVGRNEVLTPPAIGENAAAFKLIGRDPGAAEDHYHYVISFSKYNVYEMFLTVGPDPDYELLEDLAVKAAAKFP
ncbi:hypothetical protein [Methanogenium sp. MK-MG]|uniref:hypothetical protein n=1 Tax=Methanogenium sp. MK-MG TaxID=2599926 RepID=UPI0013EC91B6|nr:hypothetical protein [Methanogenium sp. MK-MG]